MIRAGRVRRGARGARRTGIALSAALLAAACGAGAEDSGGAGPVVELDRPAFLLVDRPGAMRVVLPGAEPPDVGMVLPRPSSTHDAGPLPSVRLTPPAAVEFRLPELPAGARLAFAVGVHHPGYELRGRHVVRFAVELDGAPVFAEEQIASRRVPKARQRWARGEVPLDGVERVTLRTEYEGALEHGPRVGFGLLEVRAPFLARRTRATPEAPNVLLVVVDTLRADRLGCYGADLPTPALDGLAERGTLFERCYASAPWTWPSTASLLTGLAAPEHGVESEHACFLSHDLDTLAEAFQDEHVRTAAFSTNTLIGSAKNFHQGFETFRLDRWIPTRELFPDVERWLREAAEHRFFLYLHLTDPHSPYEPDADLAAEVGPSPEGWEQGEAWREIQRKLRGEPYDEERIRRFAAHDSALYDGEVVSVDRQLARLFALLGELGLRERTVVCVTSDHGEEFYDHGMYHHTKQLYEEVLRVPLVLAGPGVPAGQRVAAPVALRHLGSTLLSVAGADGSRLSGRDLLEPGARPDGPIFYASRVGWWVHEATDELLLQEAALYGSQDGARRFVWAPGEPAGDGARDLTRLFDLERDPREREDLSGDRTDEVAARRVQLEEWLRRCAEVRPRVHGGDEDALAELRALGYVGE